MQRFWAISTLLFALTACTSETTSTTTAKPSAASASASTSQQAQARIGDVVVHASAMQASALDEAFTRRHGLERSDRVAMLLVSVRRADGSDASDLPVTVTARAAPEGAALQPVSLREVRVDGLVDRIGTVDIAPPEAMQFEVSIRYGGSTSTMQFSRAFFPR